MRIFNRRWFRGRRALVGVAVLALLGGLCVEVYHRSELVAPRATALLLDRDDVFLAEIGAEGTPPATATGKLR
jgi:hypothetical protein